MKYTSFLGLALFLAPLHAAVDPGLLALTTPDANVIAGVQIEQGQSSPFGQFLLKQIQANNSARDKLIAATGFDPLRDLREVVASSVGGQKSGLLLGRGYFQPDRISSAATVAGATITKYKGVDIITGGAAHSSTGASGMAFLDSTLVALGDLSSIQSVIDRRTSSAAYSGSLAQPARDIAANNDAWVVSTAPSNLVQKLPDPNTSQSKLLQTVKQFSGGARFGSTAITVTAQAATSSAQDAQSLADALRFLVALIPTDPKTAPILATARFTANGSVTNISIDVPEDQAESIFTTTQSHAPKVQNRRIRQ